MPSRSLVRLAAFGSLACLTVEGCSPMVSKYSAETAANVSSTTGPVADYSCLASYVDYQLSTNVIDYELTGGGGLNAGFSSTGIFSGIGIGVNYSHGELDMHMQLTQPIFANTVVADQIGSGSQSEVKFDASLNIGIVQLSPSVYSTTPIGTVSQTALTNTWNAILTQLSTANQPAWWSYISQVSDAYSFYIPVGTNAGIQVGDEFKVMDAAYHWTGGTACSGEFEGATMNSSTPIALAKVTSVTADNAYLQVETSTMTGTLSTYNYVAISSLVQPTTAGGTPTPCTNFLGIGCPSSSSSSSSTVASRTSLGYSLHVGSTTSPSLTFANNQTLDITPYLTSQLSTMLNNASGAGAGFYIK